MFIALCIAGAVVCVIIAVTGVRKLVKQINDWIDLF